MMRTKLALGFVLVAAAATAACGDDDGALTQQRKSAGAGGAAPSETQSEPGAFPGSGTSGTTTPASGTGGNTPTPTPGVANSTAKQFFFDSVHPSLATSCGTCHDAQGPGPAWMFRNDKDKTYVTFENLGYIAKPSRIETKGVHNGGTGPALTAAQGTMLNQWIDQELAARGNKAPVNIKAALGGCMNLQLFNAIGLAQLRTIRRNNENANNCTGCNNAPCMTCHSSDPATGVIIAYGNNNVPANHTFEMAKQVPFMDIVIGTNGTEIVGSKKLAVKADATAKDKPYTHPMYAISTEMQGRIDAFAADVAAKYKAGQCGN